MRSSRACCNPSGAGPVARAEMACRRERAKDGIVFGCWAARGVVVVTGPVRQPNTASMVGRNAALRGVESR